MIAWRFVAMSSIAACLTVAAAPAADPAPPASTPAPPAIERPDPAKQLAVTTGAVTTAAGETINYTATAGYMTLKEEQGSERASVFYVAYVKDGVPDKRTRPVTFVFNGGPGSSSVWLHMGAAGPRRVLMGDADNLLPPPWDYTNNEHTWLDATDLVFIDPVGTGYSRPAEGREQKEFSGLENDLDSVAEFIRLYTTREQRWLSPKFLAGESYGTTRAAGLSALLQDRHGLSVNGLILISTVLHFAAIRFDDGNDLPYPLYLPTYAATAWRHGALAPDLQRRPLRDLLDEVEAFALREYFPALALGSAIDPEREAALARALSRYTGLEESFIRAANLRPTLGLFTKELLRDRRRTVGRLDSRFTGVDSRAAGASPEHDPSMTAIRGPYTAAINHYLRADLRYENDLPYEILTGRVAPWSYAPYENRYVNVGESLRAAISKNHALRVLVCSGYYDLATPHFAADWTISHLGLEPELRSNIKTEYYEAGHMMYLHEPSLEKLHRDAAAFIRAADNKPD